jgi:predicted branched-subunit amino acid permease
MIDESTAVGSAQEEPRWRRYGFVCTGAAIFVAWNISTAIGAIALGSSGTLITRAGIDAAVPAAFLALLWPRLASPDQRWVALGGALVALALVPVAPAGVPVIAGGLVALAAAAWEAR